MSLKHCPLCEGATVELDAVSFHQTIAEQQGEMLHVELFHYGAIYCRECGLTLPYPDGENARVTARHLWNHRAGLRGGASAREA